MSRYRTDSNGAWACHLARVQILPIVHLASFQAGHLVGCGQVCAMNSDNGSHSVAPLYYPDQCDQARGYWIHPVPRTAAGGHREQGRCSLAELCRPGHHGHLSAWEVLVTGFPGGSVVKNLLASAGELGSIPGSGWSPGGGNDNPLQYSCLGNPMDKGAWWATVHGVAESWTWLSKWTTATTSCYWGVFFITAFQSERGFYTT